MGKTANYNLPFPEATDKANVPLDIQKLAEAAETALGNKVNSEIGKRLITDEEAIKLAGLENYDDTELNKKIEEQATKIEELEEQNKQLLKDYKPIPFNSSSNHLVDTGDFPMPIFPNGGIEQDTREGYNHLQVTLETQTVNGLNLTVREDKSVTVKGTPTASTSKKVGQATLKAGTYTIYCKGMKYEWDVSRIEIRGTEVTDALYLNRESAVITLTEQDTIIMDVIGVANQVLDYTFFPMILEGNVTANLPTYEQYGAMPSIDFPSEVKGVTGHYDTEVSNKNIWNGVIERGSLTSGQNDTNYSASRSDSYTKITSNSNYAFSVNGKLNRVVVSLYDKDKNFISNDGSNGINASNGLFTTYANAEYLRFRSYNDDATLFETGKIQLEENTVATDYVEHQEQLLPLDLPIGQVWYSGKAYKENGKWYRPIEFEKYVFTGEEIYSKSASYSNDIYFCGYMARSLPNNFKDSGDANIMQPGGSNMFKGGLYSKVLDKECMSWGSQMHIRILASRLNENSATGLKAFFKELYDNGTPLYAVAPLKTPYTEEITDTTLIEQLENMQKADSCKEVTNINSYRASEDVAEMKLSGNALMSNDLRMSKLESALLNVIAEV